MDAPVARSTASASSAVEPFPFEPAMCSARRPRSGWPTRSSSVWIGANDSRASAKVGARSTLINPESQVSASSSVTRLLRAIDRARRGPETNEAAGLIHRIGRAASQKRCVQRSYWTMYLFHER